MPITPDTKPSGCQCEGGSRTPGCPCSLAGMLFMDVLLMGCEGKQLSQGGEGSEAQMEGPSFIDEELPCHKRFLPAAAGPRWQHGLLKINHPPGRGARERAGEVKMAEEEDFFAVLALQHHGDAGKGPLPQGGKGSYLLSIHAGQHPGFGSLLPAPAQ